MKTTTIAKSALAFGAALLVLTVVPATMAYASSAVNVPCSGPGGGSSGLIAAITSANGAGGGIINLAPGCTYKLTSPNNSRPMTGANGLPIVISPITVRGARTTIAGIGVGFRIVEVDGPGGNLTLQGLTITGGASPFGGGILNANGALTLDHSLVTGNTGAMGGGGIASGEINPKNPVPGTLTVNFSQVNGNTAQGGGGGGILNHGGTLTVNFSQVNNNTSSGGGGGIASGPGDPSAGGSSTLILNVSQVDNNTSTGGPMAGAGGIANGGAATINFSEVNNNKAPGAAGGGILNHGTMTINVSRVNSNTAANDGMGNDGMGGGIANVNFGDPGSGVLTVILTQVDSNSASGIGGGILDVGFNPADGTLTAPAGQLTLKLSRVTGNKAAEGGGIYTTAGSPVTLKLSFVGKNIPDNCFPTGSISGCAG